MRKRMTAVLTALLMIMGLGALTAPPAAPFGTVDGINDMRAEHGRITHASLICPGGEASQMFSDCFEPWSMLQLAGNRAGWTGAVGSPDRGFEIDDDVAHCDNADFLPIAGYPQSRASASANLVACLAHLRTRFNTGVAYANDLVGTDGTIRDDGRTVFGLRPNCFFNDLRGREKCDVIEQFGRALHGTQDFYSHSNWVDRPVTGTPTITNVPGMNNDGVSPLLNLIGRRPTVADVPGDLLTGCFSRWAYLDPVNDRGCIGRVVHETLNKDKGLIDPFSGQATDPRTERGKHLDNFPRAVHAAIEDTRRQWRDFRNTLWARYGWERGARIVCAITHDEPKDDCTGSPGAPPAPAPPAPDPIPDPPTDPGPPIERDTLPPDIDVERPTVSVNEGQVATNTIDAVDPDGGPVELTVSAGHLSRTGTSTWRWTADAPDDADERVTVTATDDEGQVSRVTFRLLVWNVPPKLSLTGPTPWQVFRVNTPVALTAPFTDPGADTWTCAVQWDDGSTDEYGASGKTCDRSHTFTRAGMYTIKVRVTDDDGGADEAEVMVVVYDPDAGFVTAGGHLTSPAGALAADPGLTGTARFTFNPKYHGDEGPAPGNGKVAFRLDGGGLDITSRTLEWLVVTPDGKIAVKGTDEQGNGFVLYAYDRDPDRLRMVVWPLSQGAYPTGTPPAYDNRRNTGYDVDVADPQPIDAGQIRIH